ncbi:aminoglycoside phosphotransferase family protein [Xylanibacillus composti]|nr:phosphotransferase [Xylanibacillus composti]MDT9725384.1 aminoglycoside phosphotransferase family protein [Xylanibacillus composti]
MNNHLNQKDLQTYVKNVLGSSYEVKQATRLHGGAQKVIWKVDATNGFSCVLYVWELAENYFEEDIVRGGIHAQTYGSEPFRRAHDEMGKLGVRVPVLYDLNQERDKYPFDYALVEYIEGRKAESYMQHADKRVQDDVFERLGAMVQHMHTRERKEYGVPGLEAKAADCHHILLENARIQLSYLIEHEDTIREHRNKLLDVLAELASNIRPRRRYGWIHGELGPDHVLVNDLLEPCLIDIEGAQYFDIEHEHAFLQLRFGEHYRYFSTDRLDPDRMRFYRFHHHISLTSGGLKLLHRGFPDQAFAERLAAYHAACLLQYL